jgi:SAM-dependent methyltransferase
MENKTYEDIGIRDHLKKPFWERFQDESVKQVLNGKGRIVDIGGGLRVYKKGANRFDPDRYNRYLNELKDVDILVTDYTDKFNPDQIEDIHSMTFEDNSIDGLFCVAVLEHIYSPERAVNEIKRVLKPGGKAFLYVPFIYRYHASPGDYLDYFRYTRDGLEYFFGDCNKLQIVNVRGVLETLLKFTPLDRIKLFRYAVRLLDYCIPKLKSRSRFQTSGFNIFIEK